MARTTHRRSIPSQAAKASTAAAALACLVATAAPAEAAVFTLPAGEACADFDVRLATGDGKRGTRTFVDRTATRSC